MVVEDQWWSRQKKKDNEVGCIYMHACRLSSDTDIEAVGPPVVLSTDRETACVNDLRTRLPSSPNKIYLLKPQICTQARSAQRNGITTDTLTCGWYPNSNIQFTVPSSQLQETVWTKSSGAKERNEQTAMQRTVLHKVARWHGWKYFTSVPWVCEA